MAQETKYVVNYESIIKAIGEQIQDVWYGLQDLDDSVPNATEIKKQIANIKNIEISDEQSFTAKERAQKLLQGTVYIVVRFSAGAVNYGSSVTPVSLYCVGIANKVKPVQYLLSAFASTWTTKGLKNIAGSVLQVWNTPEVVSNFVETNNEFRNLYRLTGNIVIGTSAVRLGTLKYYYKESNGDETKTPEEIEIMSFRDGYRASLDSQPFGNTYGFVRSEVNFSTYTFSISTYLLNTHFTADLLAIRHFRTSDSNGSEFDPNDTMHIVLEFDNGYSNNNDLETNSFFGYFKIVDSAIGQEIAGIPSITVTFTR